MMKNFTWQIEGMNQDASVSKVSNRTAYDIRNLRIVNNKENTLLSLENERGNKRVVFNDGDRSIKGVVIGKVDYTNYSVLFTTKCEGLEKGPDCIYRIIVNNDETISKEILYNGHLSFSVANPIDAIPFEENESYNKIYWVDGVNPLRCINLAESDKASWTDTSFDHTSSMSMSEIVTIEKNPKGNGTFKSGIVQFVATYGTASKESSIFWSSSVFYLSKEGRGAKVNEDVNCTFDTYFSNLDGSKNNINIYSLFKANYADSWTCSKIISIDIVINKSIDKDSPDTIEPIDYTITSVGNEDADFNTLFKGSSNTIIAKTITQKDNTLFLGNIKLGEYAISQDIIREAEGLKIQFVADKDIDTNVVENNRFFKETPQLDHSEREIRTFKYLEWYRFGIQLKFKNGVTSQPIWIGDFKNTTHIDMNRYLANLYKLVSAKIDISSDENREKLSSYGNELARLGVTAVQPIIVYTDPLIDSECVMQGVVNPTLYRDKDRSNVSGTTGVPYSFSSWFFRPMAPYGFRPGLYRISSDRLWFDWKFTENDIKTETLNWMKDTEGSKEKKYRRWRVYKNAFATSVSYASVMDVLSDYYTDHLGNSMQNFNHPGIWWSPGVPCVYYSTKMNASDYNAAGSITEFRHDAYIPIGDKTNCEIPCWTNENCSIKNRIRIDQSIVTFHSPEIEIGYDNSSLLKLERQNLKFRIVGLVPIVSTTNDICLEGNAVKVNQNQPNFKSSGFGNFKDGVIDDSHHFIRLGTKINLATIPSYSNPGDEFNFENRGRNKSHMFPALGFKSHVTVPAILEYDKRAEDSQYSGKEIPQRYKAHVIHPWMSSMNPFCPKDPLTDDPSTILREDQIPSYIATKKMYYYRYSHLSRYLDMDNVWSEAELRGLKYCDRVGELNSESEMTYSAELPQMSEIGAGNKYLYYGNVYMSVAPDKAVDSYPLDYVLYDVRSSVNGTSTGIPSDSLEIISSSYKPFKNPSLLPADNPSVASIYNGEFRIITDSGDYKLNFDTNWHYKTIAIKSDDVNAVKSVANANEGLLKNYLKAWTDKNQPFKGGPGNCLIKFRSNKHGILTLGTRLPTHTVLNRTTNYFLHDDYVAPDKIHSIYVPSCFKHNEDRLDARDPDGVALHVFRDLALSSTDKNIGPGMGFLWLGELYRDSVENRFGGNSTNVIANNKWLTCGPAVSIEAFTRGELKWTEGDTFYQRYEHIKTYEGAASDLETMRDAISFMCETRINLEGMTSARYHSEDNTRTDLQNFNNPNRPINEINTVYSSKNDAFLISGVSEDSGSFSKNGIFDKSIVWSASKNIGEKLDTWLSIDSNSMYTFDGDKGRIIKIVNFNDQIIVIQERGTSILLFNNNIQISNDAGLPLEIVNSGKVTGKKLISNNGIASKESVLVTSKGLYLIDSYNKQLLLYNGNKFMSLSDELGMRSWINRNANLKQWAPAWSYVDNNKVIQEGFENTIIQYDLNNKDVLFINRDDCLAFNETLEKFTGFFSYSRVPYMMNIGGKTIASRMNKSNGILTDLWIQNEGDYNMFFGEYKPYSIKLIANPEPTVDKTFTNLEFRADSWSANGQLIDYFNMKKYPFDTLQVENEYQNGILTLRETRDTSESGHTHAASLRRKFRIWRANIPRDNSNFRDRIRNTWTYIKLSKEDENINKTILHDVVVNYIV